MAKLNNISDKKPLLISLGVLTGVAILGSVAFYLTNVNKAVVPAAQKQSTTLAQSDGSLGSATGNSAYNQSYQERLLQLVNTTLEQNRNETKQTLEGFRKEQENRVKDQQQAMQDLMTQMQQQAAKQQSSETSTGGYGQVEPIKTLETGSNSKGNDNGFFGTPQDAKTDNGSSATGAATQASKAEPNIPPNGFVHGRTLNGIVAIAGASEPTRFLVRLKGVYKAPNGFKINWDGCNAQVEGRANLGSGRIDGKPAQVTCDFPDGSSKTWDVSGYIVDSNDGVSGMVGVVNDNGGKKVAGSMIAGGIGMGGSALAAEQNSTYSGSGGATTALTGSVGKAMLGGMVSGGGNEVSKQLNDYYNAYPSSVQVGGARDVDIVLMNELTVPEQGKQITPTKTIPKNSVLGALP